MFGSAVLDVAIGLVLVYLLISILLTSVSEAIEAVFKSRASDLEKALSQLFQNDPALLRSFYEHPLISGLYVGSYQPSPAPAAPAADGATPPAAEDAAPPRSGIRHGNLPSYIPREAFSAAVMDLLQSQQAQQLQGAVAALATRHGADPAAIRRGLESWYDGAMDRASGWFKRRTHWRLFLIGLAIALIGNVNSVTIAQYLALNQEAREAIVALAPQVQASAPLPATANSAATADGNSADAAATNAAAADGADNAAGAIAEGEGEGDAGDGNRAANAAQAQAPAAGDAAARNQWLRNYGGRVRAIGLPIGWSDPVLDLTTAGFPPATASDFSFYSRWVLAALILLAGYLATAFAVMLGAPFWFDILNKLMIVRSTVKPREKSPDEPPVDGPAPPPPPPPPAVPAQEG